MSGCAVCVYDLYEESLQAYKDSLVTLRASLQTSNIPEQEWPDSVRLAYQINQKGRPAAEASMDAFAALEANLKLKAGATGKLHASPQQNLH